jgi:hypothetical protein
MIIIYQSIHPVADLQGSDGGDQSPPRALKR